MSFREDDPKRWEASGYTHNEGRCDICGATGDCKIEPRFSYVTCRDHANVPPARRHLFRETQP